MFVVLQVTAAQQEAIEQSTRKQAGSAVWHMERKWRITASRFGDIAFATERRNREKLCQSLFSSVTIWNKAIFHGQQYEAVARKLFEQLFDIQIRSAGLFISVEKPWLAASPDGIIDDDCLIEIKCPYRGRNSMITPSAEFPFLTYNGDEVVLKQHSKYFCQVQGQLYITGRRICKFFVYTFVDMFLQEIAIDVEYCKQSLIPKLDSFYCTYFRRHIARSLE